MIRTVDEVGARRLARLSVETRELLALGWWWVLEDNPPCLPWCTTDHSADEFRTSGVLLCGRLVSTVGKDGRVEVAGTRAAVQGEPGRLIDTSGLALLGVEHVDPADVGVLCASLRAAEAMVGGVGR